MGIGEIVTSCLGLVALVGSVFYNRKTARSAAISSEAARDAADAAMRQVALAEEQDRRTIPAPISWRLDWTGPMHRRLRNVGSETAYDVSVASSPPRRRHRLSPHARKLEAGHAIEFSIFRFADANTIVVGWRDKEGHEHEQAFSY